MHGTHPDGLRARGVTAACLSLGGDVRAYGPGTDADGWQVPVEDPLADATPAGRPKAASTSGLDVMA